MDGCVGAVNGFCVGTIRHDGTINPALMFGYTINPIEESHNNKPCGYIGRENTQQISTISVTALAQMLKHQSLLMTATGNSDRHCTNISRRP